jgi:hypothetical protein
MAARGTGSWGGRRPSRADEVAGRHFCEHPYQVNARRKPPMHADPRTGQSAQISDDLLAQTLISRSGRESGVGQQESVLATNPHAHTSSAGVPAPSVLHIGIREQCDGRDGFSASWRNRALPPEVMAPGALARIEHGSYWLTGRPAPRRPQSAARRSSGLRSGAASAGTCELLACLEPRRNPKASVDHPVARPRSVHGIARAALPRAAAFHAMGHSVGASRRALERPRT